MHEDGGVGVKGDCYRHIELCHPNYEEGRNVLLTLSAFDDTDGGLHHDTAKVACGIVACNRWDGFLTPEKNGIRLANSPDDVLKEKKYYFYLPPSRDRPSE